MEAPLRAELRERGVPQAANTASWQYDPTWIGAPTKDQDGVIIACQQNLDMTKLLT
jgi:hypothetical protein